MLRDIAYWRTKRQMNRSRVSTPCLDDHHCKKEELESVGGLSEVSSQFVSKRLHLEEELEKVREVPNSCSQMVRNRFYLARIGRPDILLSVNKLADRRLGRVISCIHHTNDHKQ